MATGVTSLLTPIDPDDLFAIAETLGTTLGLSTADFQPGEPAYAILDVASTWLANTWNTFAIPALSSQFLDYATGSWLSLRAALDYNRPQAQASFAGGMLTVVNQGNGYFSLTPGQLRVQNAAGNTYTNTTFGTLTPWAGGSTAYPTVQLQFTADVAGSASSCLPGGILTTPVSGPAGVVVQTNATPFVGNDAELESVTRQRCKAAVTEGSAGGPRGEYLSVAMDPVGAFSRREVPYPSSWNNATTGAPIPSSITRAVPIDLGLGNLQVALATASGPASGNATTPDTDVFKANAAIQCFVVPPGITCQVVPATAVQVPLGIITLYIDQNSGISVAEAIANATANLTNFFATLPIGGVRTVPGGQGYVLRNKILSLLTTPPNPNVTQVGLGIFDALMPSFTADLPLPAAGVAVPSFTITAVMVAQ